MAQSQTFIDYDPHPERPVIIEDDCQERLNYWKTIETTDSIHIVNVRDIQTVQEDGRVMFTLPGIIDTIYGKTISVTHGLDSTLIWSGVIDCNEGNLMLVSNDSLFAGYINYQEKTYTLKKLCGDILVLIEHTDIDCHSDLLLRSHVYPNPVSTNIKIELDYLLITDENYQLTIFDSFGNIRYSASEAKKSLDIDISNYSDGIYFLSVSNHSYYDIQKFIIKH